MGVNRAHGSAPGKLFLPRSCPGERVPEECVGKTFQWADSLTLSHSRTHTQLIAELYQKVSAENLMLKCVLTYSCP